MLRTRRRIAAIRQTLQGELGTQSRVPVPVPVPNTKDDASQQDEETHIYCSSKDSAPKEKMRVLCVSRLGNKIKI